MKLRMCLSLLVVAIICTMAFLPFLKIPSSDAVYPSITHSGYSISTASVTAGNQIVIAIEAFVGTSAVVPVSVTDAQLNSYTQGALLKNFYAGVDGYSVSIYTATASATGSDAIAVTFSTTPTLAEYYYYDIAGTGNSWTFSSGNQTSAKTCGVVPAISGGGITIAAFAALGSSNTYSTQSVNSPFTFANNQNPIYNSPGLMYGSAYSGGILGNNFVNFTNSDGGSDANYHCVEVAGQVGFSSASGCSIYACSTFTYTVTTTNFLCLSGYTCTTTTGTTTVSYDATSTVLTTTSCTSSDNGCVAVANTTTIQSTSTAVSTSLVSSTVTSTTTFYRINAPDPGQAAFWIFPIVFIGIGEAITLSVFTGIKGRAGLQVDQKTMLLALLIGATIGSVLGVGAGVVNFIFPILFTTLTGIYAWASR